MRSIVIGPVDRLTVNTEQLLPADGIVVATDGSIIYRQHPLCLMPEATMLNFYATHSRLWNAGRFHASKLLPMIFVDTHNLSCSCSLYYTWSVHCITFRPPIGNISKTYVRKRKEIEFY